MTTQLLHLVCRALWLLGFGDEIVQGQVVRWHLNADKYAQCNHCGYVDRSQRFDLPEDA